MSQKLTGTELKIFNLIKQGKTRDDIVSSKITTPANLGFILTNIYKKTESIVNYHTAKNKFEELRCYLRNNPDSFSVIPSEKEDLVGNEVKEPEKKSPGREKISTAEIFKGLCAYLNAKYDGELEKINAKRSVVNDIENFAKERLLLKL